MQLKCSYADSKTLHTKYYCEIIKHVLNYVGVGLSNTRT